MPSRIGDLVVLGDRETVFGGLETETEKLAADYRSHGGLSEARVPIVVYNAAKAAVAKSFLVLPPSGAVTGVYAYTDTNRGVWKAPANVPLSDVLEPVVKLDAARE